MSNEFGSGAAARDAGVARIRNVTRGALVGAALLSGIFAGLAAASTHVRKGTHVATDAGRRTATTVPAAVPAPAPSSAVPVPVAPSQAPSQSTAPPVASSGGS